MSDVEHENKNKNIEAAAEQWVNLVFAQIEAKKQKAAQIIESKAQK